MQRILIVVACTGIALLAGCGRHQHGAATLVLSPAAVSKCAGNTAPVAIDVHWDATKATKSGIKIWVDNQQKSSDTGIFSSDNPGTLWLAGAASGKATTGQWIVAGTRIVLTDSDSGDVLAETKVAAAPCR
jgi:hypothetical protein